MAKRGIVSKLLPKKFRFLFLQIGLFALMYGLTILVISISGYTQQTAFSFDKVVTDARSLSGTVYILTFIFVLFVYGLIMFLNRKKGSWKL